jgi:hypothetical protein
MENYIYLRWVSFSLNYRSSEVALTESVTSVSLKLFPPCWRTFCAEGGEAPRLSERAMVAGCDGGSRVDCGEPFVELDP